MPASSSPSPPNDGIDPSRERSSAFFGGLARLVLRHRVLAALLVIGLTAGAGLLAKARLRFDMSLEAFLYSGSDAMQVLRRFRRTFGRDDAYFIVVEGDVFTLPYLSKLRKLHEELAKLDVKVKTLGYQIGNKRVAGGGSRAASKVAAKSKPGTGTGTGTGGRGDDDFSFDDDTGGGSGSGSGSGSSPGSASGSASLASTAWGSEGGGSVVDEIISLINVRRTRGHKLAGGGFGIQVGELLPKPPTAASLPKLKRDVLADDTLTGRVVGKRGRASLIMLRTLRMAQEDSSKVVRAVAKIIARHNAPDFRLHFTGIEVTSDALNKLIIRDTQTLFAIAMGILCVMMMVLFRRMLLVIGPLAVVALSVAWTFGIMAAAGTPVTVMTNIIPAFLICVGVGDSVHIISVYRDMRAEGVDVNEAIINACAAAGRPVLFTTLTTAVGLASFGFATLDAVREMGMTTAVGVFAALVLTLLLLPIVLSFDRKSYDTHKTSRRARLFERIFDFCLLASGRSYRQILDGDGADGAPAAARTWRTRRRVTLLVAALLAGAAIYGTSLLAVWHDPIAWLPPGDTTRAALQTMEKHLDGVSNMAVLIEARGPRGVKDLELLRRLEKLDKHIKAYRDPRYPGGIVGRSISLLDIVKETYRALHGGDQRYYRLPETQGKLNDTLFLFTQSGPQQLRRIVSTDMKVTHLTFRLRWLEATSYTPLGQHVMRGVKKYLGDVAKASVTGSAFTTVRTVGVLIINLIRSFSIALAVITLLMILMLWDVRLALIAMMPNILPIAVILGAMGFIGIPVDMANLLIASIAIGIAVDGTIHLLHHFKVHYAAYGDPDEAIAHAMTYSGRALVNSAVILSLGFFVFIAASLVSVQRFGALIGSTVLIAVTLDLIFGPALLRAFYKKRPPAAAAAERAGATKSEPGASESGTGTGTEGSGDD